MTVEVSASFLTDLNENFPRSGDLIKEGDDHMRLIKRVLKLTMPGFNRALTITAEEMNYLDKAITFGDGDIHLNVGITSEANLSHNWNNAKMTNIADPVNAKDAVNMQYLTSGAGLNAAWPVGSIYISVKADNPSTTLKFGNWQAFGQGRVLLGAGGFTDSRGDARTFSGGQSGGTYAHQLTTAELAAHDHGHNLSGTTQPAGNHTHTVNAINYGGGNHIGQGSNVIGGTNLTTSAAGDHTHTLTISGAIAANGGNQPHNNMQPYIAVYMWQRMS